MRTEIPGSRVPDDPPSWRIAVELGGLGGLFLGALLVPMIVYEIFGVIPAIVVGIAIPVAWICVLPNSCMNGGLLFAMLAMGQLFAGCVWIVVGLVLLVSLLI